MTAKDLIAQSAGEGRTVTAPYSPELAAEIRSECEDFADTGSAAEFWGSDGAWRVRLERQMN